MLGCRQAATGSNEHRQAATSSNGQQRARAFQVALLQNKKILPQSSLQMIAAVLSQNMGVPSADYIMPPIPGFMAGAAGAGSGLSAMTHSVVRNIPATEAAFCRATRVTLVGSMTPAASRFS